ncbi:hypothetical protein K1W54_39370 [Micromonospora sp. CPCC 205371]|nr:hypothetical protein [Micromonospora sp. CPCC 205371]
MLTEHDRAGDAARDGGRHVRGVEVRRPDGRRARAGARRRARTPGQRPQDGLPPAGGEPAGDQRKALVAGRQRGERGGDVAQAGGGIGP